MRKLLLDHGISLGCLRCRIWENRMTGQSLYKDACGAQETIKDNGLFLTAP